MHVGASSSGPCGTLDTMTKYQNMLAIVFLSFASTATAQQPKLRPTSGAQHAGLVRSLAFSANGKVLASGGHDKTVKLWDVVTGGEIATLKGHAESVWFVSLSDDGKYVASWGLERTTKIWDVLTGREKYSLGGDPHLDVCVELSGDFAGATGCRSSCPKYHAG